MRRIKLKDGSVVKVDNEDFNMLSKHVWLPQKMVNGKVYPYTRINGKQITMHRLIMNPPKGKMIDHLDRDPLNNQRANLRLCTHTENMRNRTPSKNGTSKYLGVMRRNYKNGKFKWCAEIKRHGQKYRLGTFLNEDDAALAYNAAAKILFGKFANLNVVAR